MFILPSGMLEEHGPHLPIASDTFGVMVEANGVAKRVSRQLPQWNIVMMPPLHYGETGANEIGGIFVHPGTYGIRHTTLRPLVADIGAQVAQNGFKWVFVLTGHASPTHGIALNEACDFVSETFGVNMLHVSGLFRADQKIQSRAKTIAEIGKALGVKYLIVGSVTKFGTEENNKSVGGGAFGGGKFGLGRVGTSKGKANVAITARMVDVTTGEIMASARGEGTSKRSGLLLGGAGGGGAGGGGDIAFGSSDFRDTILGEATETAVVMIASETTLVSRRMEGRTARTTSAASATASCQTRRSRRPDNMEGILGPPVASA
jgi:hypothetical protein